MEYPAIGLSQMSSVMSVCADVITGCSVEIEVEDGPCTNGGGWCLLASCNFQPFLSAIIPKLHSKACNCLLII